MILFPNLGLEFEHVGTGISIFGFEITFFGIFLGLSLLAGIGLTLLEAYNTGQNMDEYLNLSIMTVLISLVGARLYYVIFQWENCINSIADIFLLRKGGLAFYGALLAGLITIVIYANVQKVPEGRILDTACIGLAAGQILSSWGSYFNREGFGEYTDGLFAMQVSLDSVSSHAVTETMRKHIEVIGGERFIQVEPLFLIEFIWSVVVLAVMILYKCKRNFEGELFLVYIFIYSFGQFWIEGIRVDTLLIPVLGWKAVRVTAMILMGITLSIAVYMWTQNDRARMKRVRERQARKFAKKSNRKYL